MHFGRFVHDARDSYDCSSDKNETACRTSVHLMAGFNKKMLQAFVKDIIKYTFGPSEPSTSFESQIDHVFIRDIELGFPIIRFFRTRKPKLTNLLKMSVILCKYKLI